VAATPAHLPRAAAPFRYRTLGLRLASSRPLPGLAADAGDAPADLAVDLAPHGRAWRDVVARAARSWRVHPEHETNGRPVAELRRTPDGGLYHWLAADGTEFALDPARGSLRGTWRPPLTANDAVAWLVGPVLGFAVRLRGGLCLHASAVAVDGSAVAFVGGSGAGKSTLAAAFARGGHRVLCDDAAALARSGDGFGIWPGARRIRLWSDSAAALFGAAARLPRLCPGWDKRFVELAEPAAARPAVASGAPLRVLYLLEPGGSGDAAPRVHPVPPREALLALLAHSYVGYFQDGPMRARELALLARVVERVPLRRLHVPARLSGLDALRDAVLADLRRPAGARPREV